MKNTLLVLVAFVSLQMIGQKKEEITIEVSKMITATTQLDFNAIMNYTYPVLFDMAPREMVVDMMKESMDNDIMKITFVENEIKTTISDVISIKDAHYALVTFPSIMKMSFKNEVTESQINMIMEGMKSNIKAENISYNKEINAIIIDITSKIIAIFDKFTENTWKFINYQDNQKEQMLMILNQEVFNALGL